MATRPELLGVKAAKCYVAAQKAKDPETRDAYLELMRHWRELADEIERFEHAWFDREGDMKAFFVRRASCSRPMLEHLFTALDS